MKNILFLSLLIILTFGGCGFKKNQNLFSEIENDYIERKDFFHALANELKNLPTKHSFFNLSMGKHLVFDGDSGNIDFDVSDNMKEIISPYSSFDDIVYRKQKYIGFSYGTRSSACKETVSWLYLTYCINGVEKFIEDYKTKYNPYYGKILVLKKNDTIPEDRCNLLYVIDNEWVISIKPCWQDYEEKIIADSLKRNATNILGVSE
jgi:hypothetical protein